LAGGEMSGLVAVIGRPDLGSVGGRRMGGISSLVPALVPRPN
jgi:hypothetical protein